MIFSWFVVIAWAGLIFYLSSIPSLNSGFGVWDFFLRKAAHVVEYAVLTGLLARAWRKTSAALTVTGILALSGLFALLYAISDEIHQAYVPGRGPSAVDVAVDACGIIAALYVAKFKMQNPHDN